MGARLVDLVRRVPSERNSSATPAQPGQRGGSAADLPTFLPFRRPSARLPTPVVTLPFPKDVQSEQF